MVVGALGVVFGDIGTSPLYTLRETFVHGSGMRPSAEHVLGVLSILFWAVTLTVTIKYVTLIMRADNKGEGGVLALATLASQGLAGRNVNIEGGTRRLRRLITAVAVIGLSLFYGDAVITPAISVMSAVEGLSAVEPGFSAYVVPLSLLILVLLFILQARGTAGVGRLFGPVMLIWFGVLGVLGLWQIIRHPAVLLALNPIYGLELIADRGLGIFWAFGSIVLAVTGAEALYADMGHFGRRPIRLAWLAIVLPGLMLNYFGQGALILDDPSVVKQVFFKLVPQDMIVALVALSALATVIASQAVISGVFSLTRQAIQLGYLPRMEIKHTSETEIGQIYLPRVNWLLMAAIVALVIGFGSSDRLAGAYGLAVTGAMLVDATLALVVAILVWRWRWPVAALVFGALAIPDLAFFVANALKIPEGGWLPLLVAGLIFYTITTWRRGRELVGAELVESALPLDQFLDRMERVPDRVAGTAVFLTADASTTPPAFLHNLKHNKILHERVIVLEVDTMDVPRVPDSKRVEVERLGKGFYSVKARYGFMEQPDVPAALRACRPHGIAYDEMETSFFLGRETLVPAQRSRLGRWRRDFFISLSHTASASKTFFRIPPNRAIELGNQIQV
ncbi:KUP system potassium uptake protein [Enhydrobacter aerosaccus]|uniref:Probable potassium transport system protein Kup n=1 Tax=Enhydrobacter aerosaccus TaxID=225324 RepID=A0A1T4T0D5_9HYPH|nr:potassium transporter Kup [Enhydrobacter aerosaccus]SKA33946.1 KUP system potassium uptake protein [Enhydrobacter aerosaccus]